MPKKSFFLVSAFAAVCFAVNCQSHPAVADVGMWPLNALPLQSLSSKYHFAPSSAWVQHIQHSCLRFRGACGSFVSGDGLVMTNDHVAEGPASYLSSPGHDYVKDGFYAPTLGDELKIPGYTVYVLEDMVDVTHKMEAAGAGLSDVDAAKQRLKLTAQLEAATGKLGLQGDVVELYGGAQYWLYRYKPYNDVRLVMVPQHEVGQLGDNADNFVYPRYNYDVSFVRVYENDKPAHTPDFLKFSSQPISDGQPVLAFGTPYDTERYETMAEVTYDRDMDLPIGIDLGLRQHYLLNQYALLGPDAKRFADDETNDVENDLKSAQGELQGLQDPTIITLKAKQQQEWAAELKPFPSDYAKLQKAESQLVSISELARKVGKKQGIFGGLRYNARLVNTAISIVRVIQESRLPEAERLPGYSDAELPISRRRLLADIPVDKALQHLKLIDMLTVLVQTFGATDPDVRTILRGESPVQRADEAFSNTDLDTAMGRKKALAAGVAGLHSSNDSLIKFALVLSPMLRSQSIQHRNQIDLPQQKADSAIARLLIAHATPETMYPDASGTLRMTYGVIKGYEQDGEQIPPWTTLGGLYEHSAHFADTPPYTIMPLWQSAKDQLDLSIPFNFVATLDSTGGNSGSPTLNTSGELVGILFDGNIQDLIGPYVHDESQGRTICLTTQSIMEGLQKVYHYDRIADEINSGHI